jgi:hypothetical protein
MRQLDASVLSGGRGLTVRFIVAHAALSALVESGLSHISELVASSMLSTMVKEPVHVLMGGSGIAETN